MQGDQLDLLGALPVSATQLDSSDALLQLLDDWLANGWLRALDRAFAGFLLEQAPETSPAVLLAAALVSHQLGHGHVCLDLATTLAEPDFALSLPPEGESLIDTPLPSAVLAGVTLDSWRAALQASRVVDSQQPEQGSCPLVLIGSRLYLRRYWQYERQVVEGLRARLQPMPVSDDLPSRLQALFADSQQQPDWQLIACALAARGRFSIITGGPGTGKTTTVVRLLALLQTPAVERGQALRIRLAAPTGKAAARLTESIGKQVGQLPVDDAVKDAIPTEVSTLHRLLGSLPDSRHFRHHAGNPLALDVLVVDEASMIDLEMMANVLAALPPQARLVLLGDKDQLASVEAGAVLGDLCRDADAGYYSKQTRDWLEQVSGQSLAAAQLHIGDDSQHALAQQTAMLRHSHRFGADSGIGELARAVNRCAADQARELLTRGHFTDIRSQRLSGPSDPCFAALALGSDSDTGLPGYAAYLQVLDQQRPASSTAALDPLWQDWARAVLKTFDRFQLLCAVRRGEWGVEAVNQRVAALLQRRGLLRSEQLWYEGRPVLVTRNDYSLGLMNGDIGIALRIREPALIAGQAETDALRVAFARNDGSGNIRFVLPSRLPEVETVFAMTVHKSQGSEFEHAVLVLPEARNPVLTKELVYTAITRASRQFTLLESRPGVFEAAVQTPVRRISGLDLSPGPD
ncbi:exodeoxyribonuclease V subunit alpha [Pseudomonas sp. 5Ae-yellow]|uniref:exodeoxyribonuclease V subunit alpha n=1 Tax=Pseudomonas sp. 5Ae-yellow TaxID=2759848 RepID=UPI0015F714B5|nr:exodeoxyribonuclease V subunit alpha [Pseudomonas sp. 5Ae-yellow]MBA6420746.1 exodeoxyribonuclease V subunit alpha [Pseudomonas sp. 5Ae-yellow]|tara:strand:+ start:4720 stop:6786 length:2067 start_codon:yes stop_codon:yes gene_type:complete